MDSLASAELSTILYVDDDRANLQVFEALCDGVFSTVTANSGQRGLEIMQGQEIAVVLVDQRMPGMTGTEVLEVISERYPDTIRLLVTAYSDLTDAINAINRGRVHRYLRKPWIPEDLRAVLRDSVETYHARRRMKALEQRLLETERVYALGVVASSVAHELRTPLTALMGTLRLAKAELASISDAVAAGKPLSGLLESLDELIRWSSEAADSMAEITRGMELGTRRRDSMRSVDLKEVIELTLKNIWGELNRRGTVRVALDPVPKVAGSSTKLGQVTLNLVVNALQALPEASRDRNAVGIRLRREGESAVLEVEDTGPGIAPEVLERVFDPFFTTKADGGTGLGLAISRRIIDELGGTIAVESQPGQGTKFTVRLPIAQDPLG